MVCLNFLCCNVLQCVLQRDAVCVAVCCSVLQCVAVQFTTSITTLQGTENCQYTGVRYKGFPYIFLVATVDIQEGTEFLTGFVTCDMTCSCVM